MAIIHVGVKLARFPRHIILCVPGTANVQNQAAVSGVGWTQATPRRWCLTCAPSFVWTKGGRPAQRCGDGCAQVAIAARVPAMTARSANVAARSIWPWTPRGTYWRCMSCPPKNRSVFRCSARAQTFSRPRATPYNWRGLTRACYELCSVGPKPRVRVCECPVSPI